MPYRVIGGPRFYERQEIRDAMAYLRLVNQPADDLAFERIVNMPRRGIGTATLQRCTSRRAPGDAAGRGGATLVATDELSPRRAQGAGDFLDDARPLARRGRATPIPSWSQRVLDESGYTGMWQADKSPEAPGRLENLKELVVAMAEFENLAGFLEHVSLVMDNAADSAGDMVNLMTLHSAKGLEFDTVFLPGWEEGLFPNQRAMEESGLQGLEEERRLAYVGLTRARRRALVSFAANRRIHGQWQASARSRFVDELPKEHIEVETEGPRPRRRLGRDAGCQRRLGHRLERGHDTTADARRARRWSSKARGAAARPGNPQNRRLPAGDRVFHQKFGYGIVSAVEDNKLAIAFDKAGDKKVMDTFVERA